MGWDFRNKLKYARVERSNGKIVVCYDAHLSYPDNPDVAKLPFTKDQFCKECSKITPEELEHVKNPVHLSADQQELMSWHCRA